MDTTLIIWIMGCSNFAILITLVNVHKDLNTKLTAVNRKINQLVDEGKK